MHKNDTFADVSENFPRSSEGPGDGQMKTLSVNPPPSVLLVDDDVELCQLLTEYLEREECLVETAHSGTEALDRALSGKHNIVILDVMLPDAHGFEVLRGIREHSPIPVLMLTAHGEEQDRIVGLEMGADDYLPKPFNPRELFARITAILRRSARESNKSAPRVPRYVVVEDMELDKGARVAWRNGERIDLTTVEFDLLEELLKAAGLVVSREALVRDVLGREFSPFDRSIDTHVSNLRKKLGPAKNGLERIKCVRGIGYLYSIFHTSGGTK
jgi:DNA-binding response OmpR family regulator